MKKILMTLVVVSSIGMFLCFTGCSKPSTPDKVAVAFFEKLMSCDVDGAAKYGSKNMQTMLKGSETDVLAMKQDVLAMKMNGVKVEVDGEPKIEGDTAKVKIKFGKDGKTVHSDVDLVKEDGKWKVHIDAIAMQNHFAQKRIIAAEAGVRMLQEACIVYFTAHKKMPATLSQLVEGADPILDGGDSALCDPWNNKYEMELKGKNRVIIKSAGEDGQMGTEDDIRSDAKRRRYEE